MNLIPANTQYVCGDVLGSGQFSKVYKGYNKSQPDKPLAIKVLNLERLCSPYPEGHGPMYRKYWNREMEVMNALKGHPNIVCLEGIENFDDKIALIGMNMLLFVLRMSFTHQ
jgi:serine/threonine protein kinase